MSSKINKPRNGIVYSTDPDFKLEQDEAQASTLPPGQQKLRVLLDTKKRAGKAVTLVTGFIGTDQDADELGKKLKGFCGTGGSVKGKEIIIQGDQRDKVAQWLKNSGYSNTKRV